MTRSLTIAALSSRANFKRRGFKRCLSYLVLTFGLSGLAQPAAAADNTPPEGFKALFNGKDLAGWKADDEVRKHWTAVNGVLTYDGKGKNLATDRDYGNFELWIDWKIDKGGDSGIYLRGLPQVQIWDNPIGSGGLFNNKKPENPKNPLKKADKPVGEWNTFRIVMRDDKVTIWLNGEKVVDNVTMEDYRKGKENEKLPAKGTIELQHHGNPLQFKNIYIKELD